MPVVVASLSIALAACGGGSKPKATHSSSTPAPTPSSAVTTGGVHATLSADGHAPVVNKAFHYTVVAMNSSGRPLSGTVDTEFAFSGVVEGRETPPTHRLKHGVLRDTIEFPAEAVGYPLELQTVVHTSEGTVTLDWPVTVKR